MYGLPENVGMSLRVTVVLCVLSVVVISGSGKISPLVSEPPQAVKVSSNTRIKLIIDKYATKKTKKK